MKTPRFQDALFKGFSLARHSPRVVALGVLPEVADGIFTLGLAAVAVVLVVGAVSGAIEQAGPLLGVAPELVVPGILQNLFSPATVLPLLGVAVCATLIVGVLRLLWISAAGARFEEKLTRVGDLNAVEAGTERLDRVLLTGALLVPLELAGSLYILTSTVVTGLAFAKALATHQRGAPTAFAFAFAVSLALVLHYALSFLARLSLLRAAATGCSPTEAIAGGARVLFRFLPTVLGLALVFSFVLALCGAVGQSGAGFMVGPARTALVLGGGMRLLSGLAAAALVGFVSTAQLGAWALLDAADRGVLPEPPPPPPPPAPLPTEPVLSTELVLPTEPLA